MDNGYYILKDSEKTGPFTFAELNQLDIDVHSSIMSPSAGTWQDACDLEELYPYFEARGIYLPTGDNLASFWWRLLAFVIDYTILCFLVSVFFILAMQFGFKVNMPTVDEMLKYPLIQRLKIIAVGYLVLIIYNSLGEASPMEGSFGKRVCKLVVVDIDGFGLSYPKALLRSVGKVISILINGIGFLSIFWSEHKQALHDFLAKTYVVKRS